MSRKIRYSGYSFFSCPIEAQTFLSATGIVDTTITSAICTLVSELKDNGLWSKMTAIYPMVGGTATTHKFNLKDPQDLDSAFRLDFNGGWTHSANGALPNGINAFADTHLDASLELTNFNTHLSFYSRTNSSIAGVDIGSSNGNTATSPAMVNYIKWVNNNSYFDMNSFGDGRITVSASATPSTGLYVQNRISNNLQYVYRRGVQFGSDNTATESQGLPSIRTITIGGSFIPPSNRWSNRECAFASIGEALTKPENVTFDTIIDNFQTTLSRNV